MFNANLKARRKEERDAEKRVRRASRFRLYNGWNAGRCEEYVVAHKGLCYTVEPKYYRVIDDYDEAIGSVELSHRETRGYAYVTSYEGESDELDFTFMPPQDFAWIEVKPEVKKVKINAVNIRGSRIMSKNKLEFFIDINIGLIDLALSLKGFIEKNLDCIESIHFTGNLKPEFMSIIKKLCAKFGVTNITFEEIKQLKK